MRFSPVSQHSFTFRMLIVFLGTILFALILSSNAWCAMVSGNVTEESGKGVAGVKISIADPTSGKTIALLRGFVIMAMDVSERFASRKYREAFLLSGVQYLRD